MRVMLFAYLVSCRRTTRYKSLNTSITQNKTHTTANRFCFSVLSFFLYLSPCPLLNGVGMRKSLGTVDAKRRLERKYFALLSIVYRALIWRMHKIPCNLLYLFQTELLCHAIDQYEYDLGWILSRVINL